ncbi:helix-turn-helix domain-containing protein [Roseivirga seohaensis]|uniref:helix-turn-helix domain-containing protein n=1 Tax=Roseivirga seohaensis TaxID=1914963 RepID=UPI003BAB59FD
MDSISTVLKQARESKGLLLREVGAAVNIDTSMVSKYEKGERLPSPKQVISFAQFYEMDKDYLLTLLLSDRILQDIEASPYAMQALQWAWEKLQNRKKR